MIEFFQYLNSIHPLSAEATSALLKIVRAKELRRGQVWLQEGAVCDKLTFVLKGMLKLYFESDTKELVLQIAKENDWVLSVESYIDKTPSTYSIRSIEPSVVVYVQQSEWQYIQDRFPELQFHMKAIGEWQIRSFEQHAVLLLLPPRERFEKLILTHSWLADGKRITDRLLAAYLGVGANAVCLWRKDWD